MSTTKSLKAESRARTGSGVLKQMRREGWVPSVVYGGKGENKNVKVPTKLFTDMVRESASANFLVDLELEGGEKQLAFVQDMQKNALSGAIVHADFLAVDDSTEITAMIPITLAGEPAGVKLGGLLEQLLHSIEITCLPKNLPETISVNVEELNVGDMLHINEITLPEGVVSRLPGDVVVALVAKTRAAQSEDVEEEGGEASGEEGAEETPAEGEESS